MRLFLVVFAAFATLGSWSCNGGEDVDLRTDIPCDEEDPCPTGYSCRVNKCFEYGSLEEGETCTASIQCRGELVCREFICEVGCTDLWYLDECQDRTWCKPLPGETVITNEGEVPAGECVPSECNPAMGDRCTDDSACVAIAADVGACLSYCTYDFDSQGYFDTCADTDGIDYACQPMGMNTIPVCFPAGGESAPDAGLPGCDAVRNPCSPGSICYNVVCRELCSKADLAHSCGEMDCIPVGARTDLAFCKAN